MLNGERSRGAGPQMGRRRFLVSLGLVFHCTAKLRAAEITVPEPQAKAAFLFGFAKYVEWPASAYALSDSISIHVVGDDQIAQELKKVAEGRSIGGRPVVVHNEAPGNIKDCRLLFISSAQKANAPQLLRNARQTPTLTVGDFDSFLDAGGMINLNTKGTRIRFEVNLPAAERAGLALNAKLLALAEKVRGRSGN